MTALICFMMAVTNAQGFYYCAVDHNKKIEMYIQERGMNVFMGAAKAGLVEALLKRFNPFAGFF